MLLGFNNKRRVLEAEAFRDGTQALDQLAALAEIQARFAQEKEKSGHNITDHVKALEANKQTLQEKKEDSKFYIEFIKAKLDGCSPKVVRPLLGGLCVPFIIAGEAVLLAPVMDGFGITNENAQYLLAGVTVITLSIMTKFMSSRVFSSLKPDFVDTGFLSWYRIGNFLITSFLVGFVFIFSIGFGWWRSKELIFASSVEGGFLEQFLSSDPLLTGMVIAGLTIGLPFATLVLDYSCDNLSVARTYYLSRFSLFKNSRKLNNVSKKLEAANKKLDHEIKFLDQKEKEHLNIYKQNYNLGYKTGAHQQPLWQVIVKIVAVVFLLILLSLIIDIVLATFLDIIACIIIDAAIVLGFGLLYGYFALKSWDRPTALQLYKNKATIWRESNQQKQRQQQHVRRRINLMS